MLILGLFRDLIRGNDSSFTVLAAVVLALIALIFGVVWLIRRLHGRGDARAEPSPPAGESNQTSL